MTTRRNNFPAMYRSRTEYLEHGFTPTSDGLPCTANPRPRHARPLQNEPGVEAGEIIWLYNTCGRELVIRDYFAEGSKGFGLEEDEEDEWGENPTDLIGEDEHREYFGLQSEDEEIDNEIAESDEKSDDVYAHMAEPFDALREIAEQAVSALTVGTEVTGDPFGLAWDRAMAAGFVNNEDCDTVSRFVYEAILRIENSEDDGVTEVTTMFLESEQQECKELECEAIEAKLTPIHTFDGWASGCDTLRESRMGNRSDGLRGYEPKIHRLRNEAGTIIGEFSEVAIRRGRKLVAAGKTEWLNVPERDIVELDAIARREAEIKATKAEMAAWTRELEREEEIDESFDNRNDHEEREPTDEELEHEAELYSVQSLAWDALVTATDWTGKIDIRRYRVETQRLLIRSSWSYITVAEVRAIVSRTLRNAFLAPVFDEPLGVDEEIGGRKPWWWGRKTSAEISSLSYHNSDRTPYRHNNKPVKPGEIELRKERRWRLEQRFVA